ncbi:hypothetical protein CEXT_424921 [Caerostris extrusa]|uniref:Uncharacterized protein n=1 Tax=Caerostris extrusa TaxID=172846 RepID=A0AAV4STL6_CAEEX|nr:hypothetical protein CEXT_424921 [Caerostris extrusa]
MLYSNSSRSNPHLFLLTRKANNFFLTLPLSCSPHPREKAPLDHPPTSEKQTRNISRSVEHAADKSKRKPLTSVSPPQVRA